MISGTLHRQLRRRHHQQNRTSVSGRSPRHFRPLLETLEDRSLPSMFTVIDLGDAGAGSGLEGDLRYCLNRANTNHESSNTIVFDPSLDGMITLTQGKLVISKSVDIAGPGRALLKVSGNHQSGVFDVTANQDQHVEISDLTIADGTGVAIGADHGGGGVYNRSATVTLTRAAVVDNSAVGPSHPSGGGIYNDAGTLVLDSSTVSGNSVGNAGAGGGIYDHLGTLVLTSSTISDNHVGVDGEGGGIATSGSSLLGPVTMTDCTISGNSVAGTGIGPEGIGGGIYNAAPLTMSGCVISGNTSDYLGGGFYNLVATANISNTIVSGNFAVRGGGGIFNNNGRVTFTDSTIAENASSLTNGFGGGLGNNGQTMLYRCTLLGNSAYGGGAIFQGIDDLILNDCTISGNTAARGGGGIYANQGVLGTIQLTSVTITGNVANGTDGFDQGGGGIWLFPSSPNRLYMRNSLVAGNATASIGPDVKGTVISLGYNLVGKSDDSQGWVVTDLTGTSGNPLDPHLGPLQDNGGPTLTHAVLAGSPVIQAGDPALTNTLDQRGTVRLFSHNPDIGAFQAERIFSFRVTAPSQVAPGEPFSVTVTALDIDGHTASTFVGGVHFTSTDPAATLPDDYVLDPAEGGVHTFTVTLETPGDQTIQATDVDNPLHTGNAMVTVESRSAAANSRAMDSALWFWEALGNSRKSRKVLS